MTKEEVMQNPLSEVMNPKDISNNAALDRNMLSNALSGAPFVIEDEISEYSRPGHKREFSKMHLAPVFNENGNQLTH